MLINYVELIFGNLVEKSAGQAGCFIRWMLPYDIINLVRGDVPISDYKDINREKVCLINISYASLFRSVLFDTFQFIRIGKIIKKFFKV